MTYIIQSGDTLFKIAQKFYGDGNRYMEIANANDIDDPNSIYEGDLLEIPGVQSASVPSTMGPAAQTPAASTTDNSVLQKQIMLAAVAAIVLVGAYIYYSNNVAVKSNPQKDEEDEDEDEEELED